MGINMIFYKNYYIYYLYIYLYISFGFGFGLLNLVKRSTCQWHRFADSTATA